MVVNGKEYALWGQFIEDKAQWIGGTLQELQDSFPTIGEPPPPTKITDIRLEPNGKDDAMFTVEGEDYSCAGSTEFLGVTAGEKGWITLYCYGHEWRIKKPGL